MKRLWPPLLITIGTLWGCSVTLTIKLPDQRFQAASPGIPGVVFYPAEAVSFSPLPGSVTALRVQGKVYASRPLNTTLVFRARLQSPQSNASCTLLSSYEVYACMVGVADAKVGEATFLGDGQADLTLQGSMLASGVRQGRFWLGLEGQGLPTDPVELLFTDLTAYVTLSP